MSGWAKAPLLFVSRQIEVLRIEHFVKVLDPRTLLLVQLLGQEIEVEVLDRRLRPRGHSCTSRRRNFRRG